MNLDGYDKINCKYPSDALCKNKNDKSIFYKDFKINAVYYKVSHLRTLVGLKLKFTNGLKTPMFETEQGKFIQEKTVSVPTVREIRGISFLGIFSITGLRFTDSDGNVIFNEIWERNHEGG